MSPIITPFVGDNRTRYHAHEDVLCKLPFFKAALHGSFQEAHEKTIRMPEDDPEAVAALIKWLDCGTYEFDGNRLQKSTLKARKAPKRQGWELLKCLFHLEVLVVASKYDSQDLLACARQEYFKTQDKMFPVELLQLWRAYFTTSLDESQALGVPQLGAPHFRKHVSFLLDANRAELTCTIAEFPSLGVSLLEACVGRESIHDLEPSYLLSG